MNSQLRTRSWHVVFYLGCVALLALFLRSGWQPALGQNAQETLLDVRANQVTTADQHEPTLAVDPTNPNNVLSASKDWRTGPKQVWHYRSRDGGRTWADGYANNWPGELPNQSDPVIAFDATGAAYMAVLAYNQNDFTVGGLFISRSNDKGVTWQQPALVSANSDTVFNDKEWMTTDRSNNAGTRGNVYVSWTIFTEETPARDRAEIVLSRSTDGGRTFSPRTLVSLPDQDRVQGSYPAVGPNGEVYVLYYSDNEDSSDALYVAKSTDGGQSFPKVRRIADVRRPPSPFPGSEFRVFVLPSLAVDPVRGDIYATWNDYAAGDSDVMLVASSDGGETWGTPRRVNDDPPGTQGPDQFFPAIVVGMDSAVHLLWLDRRDDPANRRFAPYYSRSTDGGKTFSPNKPLTRVLSDPAVGFEGVLIGDYIAIDVSGDGKRVYAAWIDNRNGDQDIYFASFDSQSGPPDLGDLNTNTRPAPVAVPSPQPLQGFTDREFIEKWERADRAVLTRKASRPWLWGPVSFAAAREAYAQGNEAKRDVQYFDKARMEINNPSGNRDSPFFVTNGLLVVELMSGRIQTGDAQFEPPRPQAQIPVAGDTDSPDALTYASMASVASLAGDRRASDRTGQPVIATLNRQGQVRDDPARGNHVRLARYETATGHNIADVFWNFMNSSGPVYNGRFATYSNDKILDWVTDLGLPITEPYWTSVRIRGVQTWVLVQAFQRRVLTYVAANPQGWQVEMGNVGRHYYDWRYGPNPQR